LSLLAFVSIAGLIVGLETRAPRAQAAGLSAPPTAVVLVVPSGEEETQPPTMPAPAELAALVAAPLPAPRPIVGPLSAEHPVVEPSVALPSTVEPPVSTSPVGELPDVSPALPQPEPAAIQEHQEGQKRLGGQEVRVVTYADLFQAIGTQTGIDWRLLAALAYRESRLNPVALGRDGDMGLMQILPTTWDEFAPSAGAANPFDPWENAQVAATYLVYLQEFLLKLGSNDLRYVLVAYNWGPERVRLLLERGGGWEDVPALQQRYVADILYAAFKE
ncbi:MAG: transglycosylase SLT domain-containing protein, partial [Caldilineaceae bacterium]